VQTHLRFYARFEFEEIRSGRT